MSAIRRIVRVTGFAAVFVALGPLLAAIGFALAIRHDLSGVDKAFVILSYTIGVVPALAAGLAVAAADRLRGTAASLLVLLVGLAAGGVMAVFMAGIRGADRIDGDLAALIVSCVAATFACWGIARICDRQASPEAGAAR